MAKSKLLLLALLFIAIPKGLYAYTNGQIVKIDHMNYKVTSIALHQLAFLNADNVAGELVIPGTVPDGHGTIFTVKRISFVNGYTCKNITSVKLPETVTDLDVGIFKDASLESITIPKSVKNIEENANTQVKKVPKYIVLLIILILNQIAKVPFIQRMERRCILSLHPYHLIMGLILLTLTWKRLQNRALLLLMG